MPDIGQGTGLWGRIGATLKTARLAGEGAPTRREAVVALVLALIAPWAIYFGRVAQGGIFSDAWAELSTQEYGAIPQPGVSPGSLTEKLSDCFEGAAIAQQPSACVLRNLIYPAFGTHGRLYAAAGLVAFGLILWLFYLALRDARLPPLLAGAGTLLLLVHQDADAVRLWPIPNALMMLAAFLGAMLVGNRCCRAQSRRRIALGAASLGLLLVSITMYQTIVPVALALPLYYWHCSKRLRPSLVLGGASVLVAIFVGYFRASGSGRVEGRTLGELVDRVDTVYDGMLTLWSATFLRFSPTPGWIIGLLVGAAGMAVVLSWNNGRARLWARRAACLTFAGATVAVLGLVAFIPTDDYYWPRDTGLDSRINSVSQFGAVLLALGFFAAIAAIAFAISERRWVGAATLCVLVGLVGIFSARDALRSQDGWMSSWDAQTRVLTTVNELVPDVKDGEVIMTFGHPLYTTNWVPIFAQRWELQSALRVTRDNALTDGFPFAGFRCVPGGITDNPAEGATAGHKFRQLVFVNVTTREVLRPLTQRDCDAAVLRWGSNPTM